MACGIEGPCAHRARTMQSFELQLSEKLIGVAG